MDGFQPVIVRGIVVIEDSPCDGATLVPQMVYSANAKVLEIIEPSNALTIPILPVDLLPAASLIVVIDVRTIGVSAEPNSVSPIIASPPNVLVSGRGIRNLNTRTKDCLMAGA
jgi:hypothetical protein